MIKEWKLKNWQPQWPVAGRIVRPPPSTLNEIHKLKRGGFGPLFVSTPLFSPYMPPMIPSAYLKLYPVEPGASQHLLFSTRKCSLALLPAELAAQLRSGVVPQEQAALLARLGMVVEDRAGEQAAVHDLPAELNRLNRALRVSVILGMACNFACVYCYEGGQKEGASRMNDATADQLVRFLGQRFTPGKEKLVLNLYGGETLLYLDRIRELAQRLKPLVEERGGSLEIHLVTNGSLLTPAVVAELLPLGLKSAKITVDGSAELHNQSRPLKNGMPSFDVVLHNIRECCDLLCLNLVGNYTRDNYQRFPELLDLYLEQGVTPDRVAQVQFYPAMQINDQFANPEFSSGCCSISEPWLIEAALFIREELGRRGFPLAKMRPSPCMVDIDDALVVNHDGAIYKCITMIGHKGYEAGDIWQGMGQGWQESYCLDHWKDEAQCRDCVYLPLCFGGCRYMAFQRDGHMKQVDCQRAFLDATLEPMLQQDLRYRSA